MRSTKSFPKIRTEGIKDAATKAVIDTVLKELDAAYKYLRGDIVEINLGEDGSVYFGKRDEQGKWEDDTLRVVRVSGGFIFQKRENDDWTNLWGV